MQAACLLDGLQLRLALSFQVQPMLRVRVVTVVYRENSLCRHGLGNPFPARFVPQILWCLFYHIDEVLQLVYFPITKVHVVLVLPLFLVVGGFSLLLLARRRRAGGGHLFCSSRSRRTHPPPLTMAFLGLFQENTRVVREELVVS